MSLDKPSDPGGQNGQEQGEDDVPEGASAVPSSSSFNLDAVSMESLVHLPLEEFKDKMKEYDEEFKVKLKEYKDKSKAMKDALKDASKPEFNEANGILESKLKNKMKEYEDTSKAMKDALKDASNLLEFTANGIVESVIPPPSSSTSTSKADNGSWAPSLMSSLALKVGAAKWDPLESQDWDAAKPSEQCFLRIKRDMMTIFQEPPPGMFIAPDEQDMTKIHALVTGPFDTPYEGGFFYFLIRCPPNYPINPPRVRLMTTGGGTVRFNPNLYANGKVCLSILGTWPGPSWSPALSLSSLLISIQSLMNDKPYHNEPGYERERNAGASRQYNLIIEHETVRVAVLEALERDLEPASQTGCRSRRHPMVAPLMEVIKSSFPQFYDHYEALLLKHKHLDGTKMNDPFGDSRGTYQFGNLLKRLNALKEKCIDLFKEEEGSEGSQLSDDPEGP